MISSAEAAESLRDVQRVDHRTRTAGAYGRASPFLLLSGAVWTLGYIGSGLTPPERWGQVWVPLVVVALVGTFLLGLRIRPSVTGTHDPIARVRTAARGLWLSGAIMVFTLCTFLLFRPTLPLQYLVFPALLLALAYSVAGSFGMLRLLVIGAAVFAITITGLLFDPQDIAFWVAAGGGGALLLGGFWLRRV